MPTIARTIATAMAIRVALTGVFMGFSNGSDQAG
jgi:hypothetical protein